MPAAGLKGAPKNPSELKDDTSSSRDEKQVSQHLQRLILSVNMLNYSYYIFSQN